MLRVLSVLRETKCKPSSFGDSTLFGLGRMALSYVGLRYTGVLPV